MQLGNRVSNDAISQISKHIIAHYEKCACESRGRGHVFSDVRHHISAGINLPFRKHAIVSVRPEEEPVESSTQVLVAR